MTIFPCGQRNYSARLSEITWSSFDGSNPEQWRQTLKHSLLESYIDVMILRDIIERHRAAHKKPTSSTVDFVTEGRLVEACAELTQTNRAREWAPLQRLGRRYPSREAGVVTIDSYPGLITPPVAP